MSLSSAKVHVFSGNTLLAVYNIPTNIAGTAWHVFDVDVSTGELITVNNFFSPVDSEHVTPNGGHISGDSSVG